MPVFKTLIQAENYGVAHYLIPEYKETIHGNWEVKEGYGNKELVR